MSSLRNAVQRRNHRERAQPEERAKWGLLEKRKDYRLRAADHKTKQRKLKALQEKARDRNEDEFYFAMTNSRTEGGVKVTKRGIANGGGANLDPEVIKLMKTQDVGYLRTVLQQTKRELEKLEQEVVIGDVGVHVAPGTANTRRTVFDEKGNSVSRSSEQGSKARDNGERNTDLPLEQSDDDSEADLDDDAQYKSHKHDVKRRKAAALRRREQDLSVALREVEEQRAKSNGTMGGVTKNGVRFRVPRRR